MARKPVPKSQKEISESTHIAHAKASGNPNYASDDNNRGTKQSFRGDNVKPINIGIQDIDEAIFYYFQNVIKPSVVQNGNKLEVPVLYGSPEKWASAQKDGFFRDQKGKIMMPVILVKRDSLTKNRKMSNKLDANNPNNYAITGKKWSQRNAYDHFAVLNNRIPEKQFYATVVPDYVTIVYSCVIQTYYVEQLNKIVEAINYASDAYWGDPERFKFNAKIESFNMATELVQNDERSVKSTFSINVNGYIVPDNIQKDMTALKKYSEKTKLIFSMETEMGPEFFNGTQVGDRIVTEGGTDENKKDLR